MDLRDSLNRYYYDVTVSDLRQISRTGGGELSYNSIMYLDVISYQRAQGECTVSTLANTLHITKSAVTIKVNELERLGMVTKTRSSPSWRPTRTTSTMRWPRRGKKRVIQLDVSPQMTQSLRAYEGPFERAIRLVERSFTPEQIAVFCSILNTFTSEYIKDF